MIFASDAGKSRYVVCEVAPDTAQISSTTVFPFPLTVIEETVNIPPFPYICTDPLTDMDGFTLITNGIGKRTLVLATACPIAVYVLPSITRQ